MIKISEDKRKQKGGEDEMSKSQSVWFTPEQTATYLQLTRMTIYRMIKDRRLPASNVTGALKKPVYRIRKADIDNYLKDNRLQKADPVDLVNVSIHK